MVHRAMKPTFFDDAAQFRKWLKANGATETELAIGFYKAGSAKKGMTYFEALDEALCFGWIDAVRKRIDDDAFQIRFTRRKPTSIWSAVNIAKVEKLIAEKRMTPAGLKAYEALKENKSRVYAYEQVKAAKFSPAQLKALKASADAWAFFQRQAPWYQRNATHWVTSAKKEETREKRMKTLIECCATGQFIPTQRYGTRKPNA